jgi:hypothetical protein
MMLRLPVCLLLLVGCADPFANVPFKPDPALWTPACDDLAIDWRDATCHDPSWQVPACGAPVLRESTDSAQGVVSLPTPLTYADAEPLAGAHRPDAARWGEYAYLPPQRWVYNLQEGGVVALYHPCVPASFVDDLREFLRTLPADADGGTRWILTPAPDLPTAFALLTWQHGFGANCLDLEAARAFVQAHYRHGPQETSVVGTYVYAWIGKASGVATKPGFVPSCADAGSADGF